MRIELFRSRLGAHGILLLMGLLSLSACKGDGTSSIDRLFEGCKSDRDCPRGMTCEENACVNPEEDGPKDGQNRADDESKVTQPEPDKPKGELTVRICPAYYGLAHNTGTLIAEHRETGKKHHIGLPREVPNGQVEGFFTFRNLEPGPYKVHYLYGVIAQGRQNLRGVKCAAGAPCERKFYLMVDVGEEMTERPSDEDGVQVCDFDANLD